MTWGMILAQMFKFPWCFGSSLTAGTFWPGILGEKEEFVEYTMMNVLKRLDLEAMQGYLIGAGCTVFFAVFSYLQYLIFPDGRENFRY